MNARNSGVGVPKALASIIVGYMHVRFKLGLDAGVDDSYADVTERSYSAFRLSRLLIFFRISATVLRLGTL
jgi:hypothetical protein